MEGSTTSDRGPANRNRASWITLFESGHHNSGYHIRRTKIIQGAVSVDLLHIPGHTLGLVALKIDDRYLFTGDSIFIRSIARPDLGGKSESWAHIHARSLQRLLTLPDGITVLPGHFSSLDEADETGCFAALLGDLKRSNEGLAMLQRQTEEVFVQYQIESLPKFNPEYIDMKRVNAGLLAVSEEDAATLELGKNSCALSQAHEISVGETS